ncbi:sugar transferase [Acetomicrobium sp. S15 = DSM 107314]|uniref:sugar transferase n=1 Tax=Acetomicrobium sp. S15 = DSM 107314 TaxID=2529858 RepID=UPI0018E1B68B|nr:sugar transferase [Acetomicrobium sp. S15 = DSM 107314]
MEKQREDRTLMAQGAAQREPDVAPYALSLTKRAMDILLATAGLIISSPLWLIIAIAIILDDGLPVLYTQERVGLNGRIFKLYKFRSMVRNAEGLTGPVLANSDDPRVTRVGRFLRRTALDELPQLLNIFLGDLSFVGPRPERPEFVREFVQRHPEYEKRHAIRPGLTGLAQIFGHYESPPEEKLAFDLKYMREATLWTDIKLIAKSFAITFAGKWQERQSHAKPK